MQPVNLFDLAAQQSRWLAVRQTAIAGNVANVNTPGYGAGDVEPFEKVLSGKRVAMATTQPAHINPAGLSGIAVRHEDPKTSILPSGNTVVLENELLKAGEVHRAFELNTAIVKAFHRLTMMSMKV